MGKTSTERRQRERAFRRRFRLVQGGGALAECRMCGKRQRHVCRINRIGERLALCEDCWNEYEWSLGPMIEGKPDE